MVTSTKQLSPAEKARQALALAEARALEAEWDAYRAQEEQHRKARFGIPDWTHGVYTTYSRGCRCDECRNAWREYRNESNRKYREANPLPPRPKPKGMGRRIKAEMHGTQTGYVYGCRCDRCKDTRRKWAKKNKTQKHGTEYVYHLGCRCRQCTEAHTTARTRRRERSVILPLREHGSDNGYTHYKCRCEECTKAHRIATKLRVIKIREYYKNNPHMVPDSKHGTTNGYTTYYCRCDRCKEAHRVDTAERRARKKAAKSESK